MKKSTVKGCRNLAALPEESIFGEEIMKKSTVKGCRNLAALPENGLKELKESLLTLFPQYSQSPTPF